MKLGVYGKSEKLEPRRGKIMESFGDDRERYPQGNDEIRGETSTPTPTLTLRIDASDRAG
jgi:hypothetical protein